MGHGPQTGRSWRWSAASRRLEPVVGEPEPLSEAPIALPRNQLPMLVSVMTAFVITALFLAADHVSFDVWGAFLVFPVLLIFALPIARRTARRDRDPRMYRFLLAAFVLKEASAIARYYVAFQVYGGTADAARFHFTGSQLAPLYRVGYWNAPTGKVVGTNFMFIVTGWVYAFTGATKLGGFLVFSFFGFLGLYFFYRAFRTALPDGDYWRYAWLVFFMPSLLFWPSSIGKESWMMLSLGLTALGAARLLTHAKRGFLLLALGLLATMMVRPHMSLLVLVALTVAYVLKPSKRRTAGSRAGKVLGMIVLASSISFMMSQSASFLKEQSFSATTTLDNTAAKTQKGKSAFKAPSGRNPVTFPLAVVTVFFRPFPFESHNTQELLGALEGTTLMVIFIRSRKRLCAALRRSYRNPYVAFCWIYSILFVVAYSTVGNFGIVSRERVQLYPFAFVLLGLTVASGTVQAHAKKRTRAEPQWRLSAA